MSNENLSNEADNPPLRKTAVMRSPKTCKGCRFYNFQSNKKLSGYCLYGYEVELTEEKYWQYSVMQGLIVNVKPIGKCPKPITIKEAADYRKELGYA